MLDLTKHIRARGILPLPEAKKKDGEENMYIMAITADSLELPLYVGDTVKDVAKKFNMTENAVRKGLRGDTKGVRLGIQFVQVEDYFEE